MSTTIQPTTVFAVNELQDVFQRTNGKQKLKSPDGDDVFSIILEGVMIDENDPEFDNGGKDLELWLTPLQLLLLRQMVHYMIENEVTYDKETLKLKNKMKIK